MRGPKLNEGATSVGERHGTKATAKYVRTSAYKARAVLDLIRGLDVTRADQVLQFTERSVARDIRKVLASAVANASDVDNGAYLADADELFVLACFADEGPTLRRYRPRARGRATRIRKRSCHITVVVARMSDERLEIVQARAEGASGGGAVANRRARVERSRRRAQAAKAEAEGSVDLANGQDDEHDDHDDEGSEAEGGELDDLGAAGETDEAGAPVDDGEQVDDATPATPGDEFVDGEWPGSVIPDGDGNGPDSHTIKGNADSMLYHTPGSRYYTVTKAEVWFDTEESAEAAGFSKPGANKTEDEPTDGQTTETTEVSAAVEGSTGAEPPPADENEQADEENN